MPSIFRDPRHYDVLARLTAPDDLPFYRRCLDRYGGPVLELGCGTGRLTLPLAQRGAAVTGLDCAEAMVGHARRKAFASRLEVDLRVDDARCFRLPAPYGLIIYPYNAINQLCRLDDLRACFASVRAHMTTESRFVIDTFQPSLPFLVRDPAEERPLGEYIDPDGRGRVVMTEQNAYDPATQINQVTWRYEINGQANARVDVLEMRIFFPQELDALLQLSGFDIEHKYGDYDESAFGSSSPKQLAVCRLA